MAALLESFSPLLDWKAVIKNPLARGSALMFIGSMIGNFANYIFNLLMGRGLGPEGYGTLAALVSVLIIVSVPAAAFSTTIVKFTADGKAGAEWGLLALLFRRLGLVLTVIGFLTFLIFFFGQNLIGSLLNIQRPVSLIILGLIFFITFPATLSGGILVGLQKFPFISFNSVFSSLSKLIFGIIFVYFGFGVEGAMLAIFISMFLPFIFSLYPLRFLFHEFREKVTIDWRPLIKYVFPALIATLGLNLLTTSDIVIVKKFFNPHDAGIYSALSLIGRVIFFASGPVTTVMFSLVAERKAGRQRYDHFLTASALALGGLSLAITLFYALFPEFSVRFFFGEKYISAAPYLWLFGLFITLFSLCNLFVNFFLSIKETKAAMLALPASFAQIILITLFHPNFLTVIEISTAVTAVFFLCLLVMYKRLDFKFETITADL